ncbi:MAG: SGNH/GDSL hydrolase family protein [Candidatus Dormibacteria bacterium]
MSRATALGVALLLALACAGCANGPPPLATGPSIPPGGQALVYAALGASETSGAGLDDLALRERYTWPQLFFNRALPRAATYYNFGVPGITTAAALTDEVPRALAVHPTVVTVFFNIDDLVNGVDPATFGSYLDRIVHAMRQGGRARVLVGNAPTIDSLPAFRACLGLAAGAAQCPLPAGVTLPPLAVVDAAVDAYDAAIAAVVSRQGAILIDVRAHSGELTANPADVAADGLHPSPLGNEVLAGLFATAYAAASAG